MGKRFIECRIFYRVAIFEALVGNLPVARSIDVERRPVPALRAQVIAREGLAEAREGLSKQALKQGEPIFIHHDSPLVSWLPPGACSVHC